MKTIFTKTFTLRCSGAAGQDGSLWENLLKNALFKNLPYDGFLAQWYVHIILKKMLNNFI